MEDSIKALSNASANTLFSIFVYPLALVNKSALNFLKESYSSSKFSSKKSLNSFLVPFSYMSIALRSISFND